MPLPVGRAHKIHGAADLGATVMCFGQARGWMSRSVMTSVNRLASLACNSRRTCTLPRPCYQHYMQRFEERKNVAAQAADIRWYWCGPQAFEHDGIVVNPKSVLFDAECARLSVFVGALSADPFAPTSMELLLARISALVVAGSLSSKLPDFTLKLYLRFPGQSDVGVDTALAETARLIANRREFVRHHGRTGWASTIPGPILAYVLATCAESGAGARKRIQRQNRPTSCSGDCRSD